MDPPYEVLKGFPLSVQQDIEKFVTSSSVIVDVAAEQWLTGLFPEIETIWHHPTNHNLVKVSLPRVARERARYWFTMLRIKKFQDLVFLHRFRRRLSVYWGHVQSCPDGGFQYETTKGTFYLQVSEMERNSKSDSTDEAQALLAKEMAKSARQPNESEELTAASGSSADYGSSAKSVPDAEPPTKRSKRLRPYDDATNGRHDQETLADRIKLGRLTRAKKKPRRF
jgi:hypothetical protein